MDHTLPIGIVWAMATLSPSFERHCPSEVFVASSNVCHCPSCWALDPNAKHFETVRDLKPVFTVNFLGEDGGYLSAVKEGFLTEGEARSAADTLGVYVHPHKR